jgi:elongation factor G
MLAFKIMNDPFVGSLTFVPHLFRQAHQGRPAREHGQGQKERIGRMLQMHCQLARGHQGGLRRRHRRASPASRTRPPATRSAIRCKPVILERMEFPEPVIEIAVEPKTKGDQEKMGLALNRLAQRIRPSASTDEESGQTIIKGMGELHLDIIVDRMRASSRSRPMSARRRWPTARRSPAAPRSTTPTRSRPAVRASSPASSSCSSRNPDGEGFVFENEIVGGAVPKEYIPGVQKGIQSVLSSGPLAGFPMLDVKATLIDGAYPRRRLLGAGLRDRVARGLPRGCQKAGAQCCSSRS